METIFGLHPVVFALLILLSVGIIISILLHTLTKNKLNSMEWQFKILQNHGTPEKIEEVWNEMWKAKHLPATEEEKLLFSVAFGNFMTLGILEKETFREAMDLFQKIETVPDHDVQSQMKERIVDRTIDHVYMLFIRQVRVSNYKQLLELYNSRLLGPNGKYSAFNVYEKEFKTQKDRIIENYLLQKMKDISETETVQLCTKPAAESNESDFESFLELYTREHINSWTKQSVEKQLIKFRIWAQENITNDKYSLSASRIIEKLRVIQLLATEKLPA